MKRRELTLLVVLLFLVFVVVAILAVESGGNEIDDSRENLDGLYSMAER